MLSLPLLRVSCVSLLGPQTFRSIDRCSYSGPMRHIALWKSISPEIFFLSNTTNMHTLTFSRHHHIEHRHRDNHNSCKHGLYYKYTLWHNYHAHFLPSACDHHLHFNNFPGPTDDNFGRWNNYYDYGWSYSHTSRSYTDTNSGIDGARKHSPGFDNSDYDYPRG